MVVRVVFRKRHLRGTRRERGGRDRRRRGRYGGRWGRREAEEWREKTKMMDLKIVKNGVCGGVGKMEGRGVVALNESQPSLAAWSAVESWLSPQS